MRDRLFWRPTAGQELQSHRISVPNGTYSNAETAALVYNIIIRLKYGSQLNNTPHLFNKVVPDSRASKVWTDADGVGIYHIDKIFINVHNATVIGQAFAELSLAKEAAKGLLAKMQAERKKKEAAWAKKRQMLKVTHREEGVAYIAVKDKGGDVRIPLDDDSWKDIMARDTKVSPPPTPRAGSPPCCRCLSHGRP